MNYDKALKKLIKDSFIRYNGYLIEKKQGYFIALGETFDTQKQAEIAIDKAYDSLNNSIKKANYEKDL